MHKGGENGAVIVPVGVRPYVMGSFKTVAGPLYVNPGIGWFPVPIRFNWTVPPPSSVTSSVMW